MNDCREVETPAIAEIRWFQANSPQLDFRRALRRAARQASPLRIGAEAYLQRVQAHRVVEKRRGGCP